MPDRVLLTGISGFLGGHLALQLLEAGYTVRGSVRNLSRADAVRNTLARAGADTARLEFVALDLLSDDGWNEATAGCRYLQHTASPFVFQQPADKMELIRPAVEGTGRAINAALAAGVERIVLTSSTAAIGYGHGGARTAPFTAADWTNLDGPHVPPYQQSKTLAERRAWELMAAAGRRDDLVAINPSGILGPLLDEDPGTSAALVSRLLDGSIPAVPRVYMALIDVRDVAALHVAAMTAPDAGGERFPISERTMSLREIVDILRPHFPDHRVPRRTAPDWLIRLAGLFDSDLRAIRPELGVIKRFESSGAAALLGRPFIPAPDAILATARSLVEHKLV